MDTEYSRRNLMKTEWKVPMKSLRAFRSPTIMEILSFISPAAFFVNVRASMLSEGTPFSSRRAIPLVSTRVYPEPAPATIRTGPSVHPAASRCSGFNPLNASKSSISFKFFVDFVIKNKHFIPSEPFH